MTELGLQILLMCTEAVLAASVLLALFRVRRVLGLAPIYSALGVFYFLATLLAGTVFIRVSPGLLMSPGSVALFPASLFAVLFIYIREDADEARRMIYALLAANVLAGVLGFIVGQHLKSPLAFNPLGLPSELFVQQPRLLVVGTLTLFVDTILIILAYEAVSRLLTSLFARLYVALALVMVFDTLVFVTGGFFEHPAYFDILASGIVGKIVAGFIYAAILAVYLARYDLPEPGAQDARPLLTDLFQVLTYRQKYEALRAQAMRDPLTGVYNRGYFDEALRAQLAIAGRNGLPLVLAIIDIDFFKRINDTHGHAEGDRALKVIADTLVAAARASDIVCRYGGEEFCLILPATPLASGAQLGERVRRQITATCRLMGISSGGAAVTATIGMAAFPVDGLGSSELIRVADRRLYQGKSGGRDRVVAG
jgi:diguanylate cyclase (GGDEF)-like protein